MGDKTLSWKTTRRGFLKTVGVTAGAAGLAPAMSAPFVSRALADTKTLKIIQWSHFVPAFDTWLDGFAKDWGKQNGVTVSVDHIPHLELPARASAEVAAGAGHDIIGFNGSGGPHLFAKHLDDMSDLVNEFEKKHGKVENIGRQIAFNQDTKTWSALPDYYVRFPGLYRKDLWDEIGMKPDTWEDIRVGGAKLKAKGHPVGIGLAHSVDPNISYRSMLWSHGAAVCDETGKHVTINSKQTLEVVKFVRALYKEAMDPEVLSWDDAGNNRFLASGRGSWIHNPISAYRTIQKSNAGLADKVLSGRHRQDRCAGWRAARPTPTGSGVSRATRTRRRHSCATTPIIGSRPSRRARATTTRCLPTSCPSRCRSSRTIRARIRPTS